MKQICFGVACACLFFAAATVGAQDSYNVYRLIPISYDPATGRLAFECNIGPFFDTVSVYEEEMEVFVTAHDGVKNAYVTRTEVVKTPGKKVNNRQKMTINAGYNLTEIQITSQIGKSAKWTISEKPLARNLIAKAVPKGFKNFYVIKKYEPCSGGLEGICSSGFTVNAADYKLLNKQEFDDTDYISLPTEIASSIETK